LISASAIVYSDYNKKDAYRDMVREVTGSDREDKIAGLPNKVIRFFYRLGEQGDAAGGEDQD
jgi:hypothetical protein